MMHLEQAYAHTDAEAVERLKALTDYWVANYGLNVTWSGARATLKGRVKGVKFDSDVVVGDGKVIAKVEAGFLAEKLGGRRYVHGKLVDYLDPAHTLEELRARVEG